MGLYEFVREKIKALKLKKQPSIRTIWRNTTPFDPQQHVNNLKKNNRIKTSRYNVISFVPLILLEQFQKLANFYFLTLIVILFLLGDKAAISPMTTLLPLIFVVSVAATKQAYEDYQRHKADNKINRTVVLVLRGDKFAPCEARHIKLGDIVRVRSDEEFPCDLVLLSSSHTHNICFVTTASFDGETNLKKRYCPPETAPSRLPEQLSLQSYILRCEAPTHDLNRFNGTLSLATQSGQCTEIPLSAENFLFRGARLKNTDYINGIVVYVGQETKIALNLQEKRRKVTRVERKLNRFILFMILLLVAGSSLVTILYYSTALHNLTWYMDRDALDSTSLVVFADIFSFISLLNNIIPISLYVTIEVQKFFNAAFVEWDLNMYHEGADEPARSNTSDIVEELGQIDYIFSDKTGTLTENDMSFHKCLIGDTVYCKKPNHLENNGLFDCTNMTAEMVHFMLGVVVCHTGETEIVSGVEEERIKYRYMSQSPDEVALLEAAASLGVVYQERENDYVSIMFGSNILKMHILHILDFDATRKRMSVIYKDEKNRIFLICKGAESHVLPLCDNNEGRIKTLSHINAFAQEGYRTLTFAYKRYNAEEYMEVKQLLLKAGMEITNRETAVKEAYEQIENHFITMGATAVEDKLQDGVEETFTKLRLAGINMWVLTGDKEETAVSISLKCNHLNNSMNILYLCQRTANVNAVVEEYANLVQAQPHHQYALLIDGPTLKILLKHNKESLAKLFCKCSTVLGCRMSPLQKSQVVNFVKKHLHKHPITLAIGDGANDCSMIEEAHVGVGIMGKEGRQAVYVSDYSFYRFKYLQNLLLFHGHNFYTRIVMTIHYFFYKNMMFMLPMFVFVFFTYYTPISIYNDFQITIYNAIITALPVVVFGIAEQPYPREVAMSKPELYRDLTKVVQMSWSKFILWLLNGVWQGLVVFFWCYLTYNDGYINVPDQYYSQQVMSTSVYTYMFICVTIQILLLSNFISLFVVAGIVLSIVAYVICAVVISSGYQIDPTSPIFSSMFSDYYVFYEMLSYPHFWLGLFMVVPLAFFPYLLSVFGRYFFDHRGRISGSVPQFFRRATTFQVHNNQFTVDDPAVM